MSAGAFPRGAYTVLAVVSNGYSVLIGTSLRVTHPSASFHQSKLWLHLRLACVKPAASVRSEPGSNSQVDLPDPRNNGSLVGLTRSVYLAQARHKLMYLVTFQECACKRTCLISRTAACASLLQVFTMSNSADACFRSIVKSETTRHFAEPPNWVLAPPGRRGRVVRP
jgi:hypothetical protein